MEKIELFKNKINGLSDDKLIELLRTTNNQHNAEVFELAKEESEKRNLTVDLIDKISNIERQIKEKEISTEDWRKLQKWNWGAFLLSPVWALANGLETKWTLLWCIPIVNIVVAFYLGQNGNSLAFRTSKINSVEDFMMVQKSWGRWGVRIFWLTIIGGLIVDLIS